jgi:DNA polymerase III epsilon subunit-like protein
MPANPSLFPPLGSGSSSSGRVVIPALDEAGLQDFFDKYRNAQKYIVDRVKSAAEASSSAGSSVKEDRVLKAMLDTNISLRDLIGYLPRKNQDDVMQAFRGLFEFDDALGDPEELIRLAKSYVEETALEVPAHMTEMGSGKGVFRFNVEAESVIPGKKANPLSHILNNLNVQLDPREARRLLNDPSLAQDPTLIKKAFKFGKGLYDADYLEGMHRLLSGEMAVPRGANMLVFDTETLGLSFGSGNVRELAGHNFMHGGSAALDDAVDPFDNFFKMSSAQVGMISTEDAGVKSNKKLIDYFNDLATHNRGSSLNRLTNTSATGDEFVDAIKPFLKRMQDADYILGHNIPFDIDQVLIGVRMTSQYLNGTDQELVSLVDDVTTKVRSGSSVVDTLNLARNVLPSLQAAPELRFAGEITSHSIENLVLQTDLIDRMVQDAGGGSAGRQAVVDFLEIAGHGKLHSAKVDARLTAKLFEYLTDEASPLKAQALGSTATTQEELQFAQRMRTVVRRSYAPTPISNIADVRNIDSDLFASLLQEKNGIRFGMLDMGDMSMRELSLTESVSGGQTLYSVGDKRGAPIFSGTAADLQQALSKEIDPFYAYANVTPLEQEVFLTRRLVSPQALDVTEDTLFSLGNFKRLTGYDTTNAGLINRAGTFFKRANDTLGFGAMQKALADAQLPTASLSMPEMALSNVMSRQTANYAELMGRGPMYEKMVGLADDLGVSHFKAFDEALALRSGKVQLPMQILQAAGIIDDPAGEMLSLSTFQYIDDETDDLVKGVTLNRRLVDSEIDTLKNYLDNVTEDEIINGKTLREWMSTKSGVRTTKADLLFELEASGKEFGVQVGRVEGQGGRNIAEFLERNLIMEEAQRDSGRIPIKMQVIDFNADSGGIRLGPAILDRFLGDTGEEAVGDISRASAKALDDLTEFASRTENRGMVEAAELAAATGNKKIPQQIYRGYKSARGKAPYALGIAAAATLGYMAFNRNQEANFYDQTMESQEVESSSDYVNYRREMGLKPAPARRLPDPLLTSYVVGNLDDNKIGHTQMGPQKYSHLFS